MTKLSLKRKALSLLYVKRIHPPNKRQSICHLNKTEWIILGIGLKIETL